MSIIVCWSDIRTTKRDHKTFKETYSKHSQIFTMELYDKRIAFFRKKLQLRCLTGSEYGSDL